MRLFCLALLFTFFPLASPQAKVVVFSEPGFPAVDSQPIGQATLTAALGPDAVFAGIDALSHGDALRDVDLLVLPYGSAVPVEAWTSIDAYLRAGGNLLVLGGQPLHVPVAGHAGAFAQEAPQDTFSRALDFRHTYVVPAIATSATFAWREGYTFLPKVDVRAQRFFAVEGRLNGLGYMVGDGDRVAAPVIVADHLGGGPRGGSMLGTRVVALDFDPQPGYWESPDGISLIRAPPPNTAGRRDRILGGSAIFHTAARRNPPAYAAPPPPARRAGEFCAPGLAQRSLRRAVLGDQRLDSATVQLDGAYANAAIPFRKPLPSGFYTVRATWSEDGNLANTTRTASRVEELADLETGPALGVDKDFLTRGGKPFFPVGTNYFGTEENGWDFSGPRNALVWEQDFADMERHGVSFVRTGVWMSNAKFVEPLTGEVNERFLRNVEAFLAAAHRHHIAVNFTFFAFVAAHGRAVPQPQRSGPRAASAEPISRYCNGPRRTGLCSLRSPPLRPHSLAQLRPDQRAQLFQSAHRLSRQRAQWRSCRNRRVASLAPREICSPRCPRIGMARHPESVVHFDSVPLPEPSDLHYNRYGNPQRSTRSRLQPLRAGDVLAAGRTAWSRRSEVRAAHSSSTSARTKAA